MSETFPLTEDAFQAIAAKLGHKVGDKRARAIIKRCVVLGLTDTAGSYRQTYKASGARSGFYVPLFRLRVATSKCVASVGKRGLVKRSKAVRWWAHPLFGEPDGRPPPQIGLRAAARMWSIDELETGLQEAPPLRLSRPAGRSPRVSRLVTRGAGSGW